MRLLPHVPYYPAPSAARASVALIDLPQLELPPVVTEAASQLPQTLGAILDAGRAGDAEAALGAALAGAPSLALACAPVLALSALDSLGASVPPPPAELLEGTMLGGRPLRLAYKASRDGWGAAQFHRKCDFAGPAFLVAKPRGGTAFGAYNPMGWLSSDDYSGSVNAFLAVKRGSEWCKLGKIGGAEAAIFDYARSGPHFGANALVIGPTESAVMGGFAGPDMASMAAAGNLRRATSQLGQSYARGPPPYGVSVFGGRKLDATLQELEVWVAEGGGRRAPFRTNRI